MSLGIGLLIIGGVGLIVFFSLWAGGVILKSEPAYVPLPAEAMKSMSAGQDGNSFEMVNGLPRPIGFSAFYGNQNLMAGTLQENEGVGLRLKGMTRLSVYDA
jgi:hypothetical protein